MYLSPQGASGACLFVSVRLFTLFTFSNSIKMEADCKGNKIALCSLFQRRLDKTEKSRHRIKWRRLSPRMVNLEWFRNLV